GLSEEELSHRLKSHAWFVAYAPSADPKIAVSVMVEHGSHGSSTAAPIAREVIKTYFEQDENSKHDKLKVADHQ
ncbi:MAG: penicillin-binding transpeptidase domain-containing protein, partial [Desulfobacterales bacterium]